MAGHTFGISYINKKNRVKTMEKYLFNIDTERKIWDRHTVCIKADSQEEALEIVVQMAESGDISEAFIYQRLDDTETDTGAVVVLDDETGEELYNNSTELIQ
jgi:hypothetical protein